MTGLDKVAVAAQTVPKGAERRELNGQEISSALQPLR